MKLYSVPASPYASRVRMQIYINDLPVEICPPPGGMGSAEFKALSPGGKVPQLDTGEVCLPESSAIMEYLDDVFAEKALRADSPEQRAWERSIARFCDIYLAQALFPLFVEMRARTGDEEKIQQAITDLKAALDTLQAYREAAGHGCDGLGVIDCVLVPTLFYVVRVTPLFGETDIFSGVPALQQYWDWILAQDASSRIVAEMDEGLKVMMGG